MHHIVVIVLCVVFAPQFPKNKWLFSCTGKPLSCGKAYLGIGFGKKGSFGKGVCSEKSIPRDSREFRDSRESLDSGK